MREPKPKCIRLSEGHKLTLEVGQVLPNGYVLTKGGCLILSFYLKLYCYVNRTPNSEVSL